MRVHCHVKPEYAASKKKPPMGCPRWPRCVNLVAFRAETHSASISLGQLSAWIFGKSDAKAPFFLGVPIVMSKPFLPATWVEVVFGGCPLDGPGWYAKNFAWSALGITGTLGWVILVKQFVDSIRNITVVSHEQSSCDRRFLIVLCWIISNFTTGDSREFRVDPFVYVYIDPIAWKFNQQVFGWTVRIDELTVEVFLQKLRADGDVWPRWYLALAARNKPRGTATQNGFTEKVSWIAFLSHANQNLQWLINVRVAWECVL